MSSGRIAMRKIAQEWLKDAELRAGYEALEPEFALAFRPDRGAQVGPE